MNEDNDYIAVIDDVVDGHVQVKTMSRQRPVLNVEERVHAQCAATTLSLFVFLCLVTGDQADSGMTSSHIAGRIKHLVSPSLRSSPTSPQTTISHGVHRIRPLQGAFLIQLLLTICELTVLIDLVRLFWLLYNEQLVLI